MRFLPCLVICLMQIFCHVSAESGKYTVIAPGTIHSNNKYTAAVGVHHLKQPCQIKVGITGPSYNETKTVEVTENELKNVEFNVPALEKGEYNITAEGVGCLDNFKNSTKLFYEKFDNHVRIQTDKGLYKPGDAINYRVIFLDKDLRPAQPEKDAVIYFEDGKRNRIKEIRDFKTTKGVYTGKFQISEFPVTGGWRLGVSNGGTWDKTVYFDVDKYVLPKYNIKIEPTESVSVKDGDMQIVVRANYTYGKPMNGKATVIITMGGGYPYRYSSDAANSEEKSEPPTIIKTADMVQGKAKIDVNVKEFEPHLLYKTSPSYLTIVTTVEEEFTGVKLNETSGASLYPYRYSMYCVSYDTCSSFQADLEKQVIFQVTYVDNTHVKDTKSPIELIYKEVLRKNHWWHRQLAMPDDDSEVVTTPEPPVAENKTLSFTSHMNETGHVHFKVSLPDLKEYEGYSHYYTVEMKYLDEQREVTSSYQYRPPPKVENPVSDTEPKEFFKLDPKSYDETLSVGQPENFVVNSSKPLKYFDYNVIARGNILKSERVDLNDGPKYYNLTLIPSLEWAPHFALYVYYVDDSGEYHYYESKYFMKFELPNQINIIAPEQVKPGEEVPLKIKTAPNSFVGLMAVDQSVLQLRANNDLHADEYKWVLGSYSTNTPYQGGFSQYPGTGSGCVTLTNADYFYNWTRPDYTASEFHGGALREGLLYTTTAVMDSAPAGGFAGGAVAAAAPSGPSSSGNAIQVRKDFSETWLFADIENTETEEFTWSKKIPDTITSWTLSAFSLNPDKGLGVTKDNTKIVTFQPFFISVRLPYSVKRGEVINVPAIVFNYLDKALDVQVTLDNSDAEYEFTEVNNEVLGDQKRTKMVRVPANGAAGVSFLLRPKVIGNVMLKYTAVSPIAGDAVHKTLKVVPEGVTQYANRAYLVNLNDKAESKDSFELELPEDIVPDSQHIEVGVMGDLLGPVLKNLDNLIRLPSGCGEQTMSKLLPNYLVMKYLENTKRLTPTLKTTLLYNMEQGYQRMLSFKHDDGSFSSFGPVTTKDMPRNGSTWLTAYVIRSLQQLAEYTDVSHKIIESGLEYLSKAQAENGTFLEKGDYFYSSQNQDMTLTSSAVLALLHNKTLADKYSATIKKGLNYLNTNLDKSDSLHAKAMGTFVLNKAKYDGAQEKLAKLTSLAKTDSDRKWWSSENRPIHGRWWFYVFSNDVEVTSYVLLTLLDQESTKLDDVFPIIKWLVAQRNSYGGFSSSQDTVLGLQALIKFVKFADYAPAKMDVEITAKGEKEKKENFKLTEDNGILYQSAEMPSKSKSIDFAAKGTGTAMVQIAYQYNILEKDPKPSFTIETERFDMEDKPALLQMKICADYQGEGKSSNMAILEINTPSGYVVDSDLIDKVKETEHVSNVELKNSDSLLVVYFDHLYKNEKSCFVFEALRTHNVAMQKPSSIVLYDYYDTSKKATKFYTVNSNLCDICDGEEECNRCK